jgi:hypothetical protein
MGAVRPAAVDSAHIALAAGISRDGSAARQYIKVALQDEDDLLIVLVASLANENPAAQRAAAKTLADKTAASAAQRSSVLHAPGALPALLALLERGVSPAVQEHAVRALANIAESEELRGNIADAAHGALRDVVALLGPDGRPEVAEQALRLVRNIAPCYSTMSSALRQAEEQLRREREVGDALVIVVQPWSTACAPKMQQLLTTAPPTCTGRFAGQRQAPGGAEAGERAAAAPAAAGG